MNGKKKYITEVKKAFQNIGKDEKKYLNTLKLRIEENDSDDFNVLVQNFGDPKDLVTAYYENVDNADLLKKISYKKYIRYIFITVLILALFFAGVVFKRYLESRNSDVEEIRITLYED